MVTSHYTHEIYTNHIICFVDNGFTVCQELKHCHYIDFYRLHEVPKMGTLKLDPIDTLEQALTGVLRGQNHPVPVRNFVIQSLLILHLFLKSNPIAVSRVFFDRKLNLLANNLQPEGIAFIKSVHHLSEDTVYTMALPIEWQRRLNSTPYKTVLGAWDTVFEIGELKRIIIIGF